MRLQFAALVAVLLPAGQQAVAQEVGNQLEEILVTAQHRTESAQSAPISLFTFNNEQLEKQRISGIANLNGLVPNLSIDSFPTNTQTLRIFIRGVGLTDTQITQDAAVGVYLDGVYIARSTGLAFDVAELERIEILRGPQGTLYGRNTTGGAITLVTKKPDVNEMSFDQTFSAGNRDLFSSKTSLNLPFADKYAAKLGYFYEDVDGFVKNDGPGGSFGDRKSKGLRFDFRAEISERLTLGYSYDKSEIKSHNYTPQAVVPRPSSSGDLLSIIGDIAQDYIDYSSNKFSSLATTVPMLPTDTDIDGHSLNLEWTVNENMTLRSITAWRELHDKHYLDFASGASEGFRIDFNSAVIGASAGADRLDLPVTRPNLDQEQFSQEFQLLGNIGESIDYMAGLYYFYEKAEEDARALHHIFSAYPFGPGTIYNIGSEFNKIENDALAFFTQSTWTPPILDERLHLTAGWRHSEDSREAQREVSENVVFDEDSSVSELTSTTFRASPDNNFSDDSFAFVLEYDLADSYNIYGKYSEAYKSGGFNIRDPDEEGFSEGFDQEKVTAWEVGFKGELFDRRLRLNAAAFYQDFDDYQFNFQIPGTIQGTRVFNIDNGEMKGIELDLMARPTTNLVLQLSYAYLDSELDDAINPFTGLLQSSNFSNAPEHTYSVIADYSWPLNIGLVNANASYNFVDDRNPDSALLYRDSYHLVNARLSLSEIQALSGEWTVAAWVKNLEDNEYEAFTFDNLPQASRAVIWGDGRSYGVDVTYRFF